MHIVRGSNTLQVLLDDPLSDLKDFVYYNWTGNTVQEPLLAEFIALYTVFEKTTFAYTPANLAGANHIAMFHLNDAFTLTKSSFVPIFDLKEAYHATDKNPYIVALTEYNFSITIDQFTEYVTELYRERVLQESSNVFAEYANRRINDIKIYNANRNNKILVTKLYRPLIDTPLNISDHLMNVFYSYIQLVRYSNDAGRRVKLSSLFEQFELSEDIPFIGINGSIISSEPRFRAITGFQIPQGWMINERKQTNDYTYKNIKGVLLKVKLDGIGYISVNIEANGNVYTTLDMEKRNISGGVISRQTVEYLDKIPYDILITKVNDLLVGINRLPIFVKEKLVPLTRENIKILDLTARYTTKQRINKSALVKTFSSLPINKIFEYRDTKSKDTTVSLYYKRSLVPLVINIEDNFNLEGSSVISVFKAESLYQSSVVLIYLLKMCKNREWFGTDSSKQKLSPETELKQLKKENVKVDSRSCQKPRQPRIDPSEPPLDDSYALNHLSKRYICNKPDYKYPGFTSKNVVCCFKKDQRNNKYYIQNTLKSDINVFVSPSNYFLEDYQTFLLKKDNVYVILDENSELQEIPFSEEYSTVQFLETVTLAQLKSLPKKSNCESLPDMSRPEQERCNHHDINKIYGYTSFSFPCCFESLGATATATAKRTQGEHLFSKNVILPDKREGTFFGVLDVFLNKVVSDNEFEKYIRSGVLQDNYSILRALMYSTKKMTSIDDLIKELVAFVTKDMFKSLSDGKLAIIFEYSDFLAKLSSFKLQTTYILDLLSKFFGVNILLLDVDRQQVICTPSQKLIKDLPYVVFLRHSAPEHYEIVIQKHLNKTVTQFNSQDRLIELLQKHLVDNCRRVSEYPKDYKYTPLTDYHTVKDRMTEANVKIMYQVVNKFNKVYLLITSAGPLPIQQLSPLEDVPTVDIYRLRNSFDYDKIYKSIDNVNKFLDDKMSILSQVVNKNKTIGLLLSVGMVIPIKELPPIKDLPVSELRWYYGDEDSYIYNRTKDTSRRLQFWNEYQQLQKLVDDAKTRVSLVLGEYLEEYTLLLKDTKTQLLYKYNLVHDLVKKLLPDESHFVTSVIARDITLDPEYNTLFYPRSKVADDTFTLESILDIRNYLAKGDSDILPMVL